MIDSIKIQNIIDDFFGSHTTFLDDGRYDLFDGVYVNIESYYTQERKERKFESHKKYVDVQYMISGEEIITVCEKDELDCIVSYDENKDIAFYDNKIAGMDYYICSGKYIIIETGKAHMPCIAVNGSQAVKKAVFKIPV